MIEIALRLKDGDTYQMSRRYETAIPTFLRDADTYLYIMKVLGVQLLI